MTSSCGMKVFMGGEACVWYFALLFVSSLFVTMGAGF